MLNKERIRNIDRKKERVIAKISTLKKPVDTSASKSRKSKWNNFHLLFCPSTHNIVLNTISKKCSQMIDRNIQVKLLVLIYFFISKFQSEDFKLFKRLICKKSVSCLILINVVSKSFFKLDLFHFLNQIVFPSARFQLWHISRS